MIIKKGEKVHIITRRLFEGDLRRHFVGEVLEAEGTTARVEGYTFIFDSTQNDFVRKQGERIRLFDLAQSGFIACIIPSNVVLHDLRYQLSHQKTLTMTDGKSYELDISEFGARR